MSLLRDTIPELVLNLMSQAVPETLRPENMGIPDDMYHLQHSKEPPRCVLQQHKHKGADLLMPVYLFQELERTCFQLGSKLGAATC